MSEMRVRIATRSEREMLERLQRRASLVLDDYRDVLLQHPDAIDLPLEQLDGGHVYVCEKGGAVIGFMVILPSADGQAELDGLFVDPGHWRSGVGHRLVQVARAVAVARGASALRVVASPQARAFYDYCDFRACGVQQTRFGPAITMTLSI
jgi:GNAT superfamily N-acetyltransferase